MDPRPTGADPLSAVAADLDALDTATPQEQVEIFGRIHRSLAAALAGASAEGPQAGQRPGG